MASKDIDKLKEKFDKDPSSKLFLPLAEEYRKEGMLDEAIDVLHKGLGRHGNYTSAKVLLGKIYHEKGLMDEALREFESVVKIVPDNLFAHKKLAEIYRDTGETDAAIKAFKTILKLNPMDEDTISNLKDIEAVLSPAGQPPEGPERVMKMPDAAEQDKSAAHSFGEISLEASDIQVQHSDAELDAFKDALFGGQPEVDDASASVSDDAAEVQADAPEAGEVSISEEDVAAVDEDLSFADLGPSILPEESPAEEMPVAFPADDESIELDDEPFALDEGTAAFDLEEPSVAQKQPEADIEDADRYVAEGRFAEAMGIYRRFLNAEPNNKMVLQRVEELRSLLKLMGRDKEILVAKLNAFLEGINKRHDEFLGRS